MTDLATVAKNLRDIEDMALRLEARAIDRSNSRDIPGGDALVNLAPVAAPRRWAEQLDAAERRADAADEFLKDAQPDLAHEEPDEFWPASEILTWWSEDYRQRLGMGYEGWRPNLRSEVAFLRNHDVAEWIWNNEIHWDDYAADIARAKAKLEAILHAGTRTLRGVPCMYDECKGKRLERKMRPLYDKDGERVRDRNGNGLWDLEDWRCTKCHRTWTEDDYARMVTAANERTKFEDIEVRDAMGGDRTETWCSADYAARKVERSVKTIRTWINREELTTLCLIAGRRLPFVSLEEVRDLAEARPIRTRRNDVA